MVWKLVSVTSVLVLIVVIVLLFRVDIPMCYNTFEEEPTTETFVLYPVEIIEVIQAQIQKAPFHYVKIAGNSMQPTIKDGDTCVCIPRISYSKGDIVSFYIPVDNKVELIAHRIVEEVDNRFKTQGDNNNNIPDGWTLDEEQIFCKIPEKNLFEKFKFAMVDSGGKFSIFSVLG